MQTASGGGSLAALATASAAELLATIARASTSNWADARGVAAQAESLRESFSTSARQIDEAGILKFVGAQTYLVMGQIDADIPSGG